MGATTAPRTLGVLAVGRQEGATTSSDVFVGELGRAEA